MLCNAIYSSGAWSPEYSVPTFGRPEVYEARQSNNNRDIIINYIYCTSSYSVVCFYLNKLIVGLALIIL